MSTQKHQIPIETIEKISKIFSENNLAELNIETPELSIKLSKKTPQLTPLFIPNPTYQPMLLQTLHQSNVPQPQAQIHKTPLQTSKKSKDEFTDETKFSRVKSPINGTFYRSPSPSSPPFVNEGEHINPGQTLCIVEAMKVMNEIKSPVAGKVVKILKKNSETVKKDDVLFIIEAV